MEGFGLLVGHLLGDYILQNDWQAGNKVAWGKDFCESWKNVSGVRIDGVEYSRGSPQFYQAMIDDRRAQNKVTQRGHLACTIHCFLYTLSVWVCSFWWMPWWGLLVCFLAHWPMDRFRLAKLWMDNISGQRYFANNKDFAPWSVIVVDNTFHLLTLFLIGVIAYH